VTIVNVAQALFLFLVFQLFLNSTRATDSVWHLVQPFTVEQKVTLFALLLAPVTIVSFISSIERLGLQNHPYLFTFKYLSQKYRFLVFTFYCSICAIIAFLLTDRASASLVTISAALLAAIGIALQQQNAATIQRKQHTMNVLLQFRQTQLVQDHRMNVAAKFCDKTRISERDVIELLVEYDSKEELIKYFNSPPKIPIAESMYYMTNYYEYIAAAVYSGDLDEELINETIGTLMRSWYQRYEAFIVHKRNLNVVNGIPQKPVFSNLWWLVRKKSFREPTIEKLLKRPDINRRPIISITQPDEQHLAKE
jgi:hypothetical protein